MHLFGIPLPDHFTVKTHIKNDTLWIICPGLLGQADDLQSLIPTHDSVAYISYIGSPSLTYSGICEALATYIRKMAHIYTIYVIGYSMGGRILYSTLAQCHEDVSYACFISSGVPLNDQEITAKAIFDQRAIQQSQILAPIDFMQWWYTLPIYQGFNQHQDFHAYIANAAARFNADKFHHLIRGLSSVKMPQTIYTTQLPAQFFYGEFDKKYAQISEQFLSTFSSIIIKKVPMASHLCWLESPHYLIKNIQNFVARV